MTEESNVIGNFLNEEKMVTSMIGTYFELFTDASKL